jgi:hypothetical protein
VLALRSTAMRTPTTPLKALTDRQYSILYAVAERLCPGDPAGLPSASELGVAEKVDLHLYRSHPGVAKEFGILLLLIENALVEMISEGVTTTFTNSTSAVQDQILDGWKGSGVTFQRTAYRALLGLCMATYWSDPRTHAWLGYPGPPPFWKALQ